MAQQRRPWVPNITLEDQERSALLARNFSGAVEQYNESGERRLAIFIPEELVEPLTKHGWNVKMTKANPEYDREARPYLQVFLKFPKPDQKIKPPKVFLVTERGKTELNESNLNIADWVRILKFDIIIRPFHWGPMPNGDEGIKAMLDTMYIHIDEDVLEKKYADVPESNAQAAIVAESNQNPDSVPDEDGFTRGAHPRFS